MPSQGQNDNGAASAKKSVTAGYDSETEPESDEEFEPGPATAGRDKKSSPVHTTNIDLEMGQSSPPPTENRIISSSRPLADFRKNIKTGDLVSKAVEDLAWVVNDVVMKPFAGRRQDEMLECMKELREVCLTVSGSVAGLSSHLF